MDIDKFIIERDKSCLLIIDIQERLYNAMDAGVRANVVRNTGILIETAETFDMPIVLTEQYSKGLGPTVAELAEKIPDIKPFDKTYFNCMYDKNIADRISSIGRKTIIITGIETHVCVLFTALTLLKNGYRVVIVSDAVCSRRKHDWGRAIKALSAAGAVIYPTESVSFMLINRAGTDEFKRLAPLFK